MKPEGSSLRFYDLATGSIPEPMNSVQALLFYSLSRLLRIGLRFKLVLTYPLIISPVLATCAAHLIVLIFITLRLFVRECVVQIMKLPVL
jgi:hypothetical protein